jgi:transposase
VAKGGVRDALSEADVGRGHRVYLTDEWRLGLRGQTRRVLAPTGVKVTQPVQLEYEWSYLLLGVEPLAGALRWEWIARMKQEHVKPVLERWRLDCVVWDGAPAHKGKSLRTLSTRRLVLPPYSPELNPAERVFEEVRRHVEGKGYASLRAKQDEVEQYLHQLQADRERVKRLCCWEWVREALEALPPRAEPAPS